MVICCPRACSRLATAAAFLGIGIVQVIAGMILLRSKYVYLLSIPDFWTAFANISVGCLLGMSAAVWKTVNRKPKHAAKRNLLAALACSAILLNGTTAAILILGESNSLLSIHLENSRQHNSKTVASEILAYAYATSVCSPIVCIVISIAFLTGICFKTKASREKKFDFNQIISKDKAQIYSWVYTPKIPKTDPSKSSSFSSESGLSSTVYDSSCSSSTISAYMHSHTSINDCSSNSHPAVHPMHRNAKVFFPDHPTSDKRFLFGSELDRFRARSVIEKQYLPHVALAKAKSHSSALRKTRSRGMPKILFTEYPSGEAVQGSASLADYEDSPLNKNEHPASCSTNKNDNIIPDQMAKNVPRPPLESTSIYEDSVQYLPEVEQIQQRPHDTLRRTSTADCSKGQTELHILNQSEIPLEPVFTARENNVIIRTSPQTKIGENATIPETTSPSEVTQTKPTNVTSTTDLKKSIDFRSKLTSKLIPVSTPVISDHVTPRGSLEINDKTKSYTKSKKIYHNYIDYHRNGLSSFKVRKRVDEVDALYPKKHNSVVSKSPMESISELSIDESNECFLPSTSAHTSGYMSALDESDNCSDLEGSSCPNNDKFPSPPRELACYNSRSKSISPPLTKKHLILDYSESLQQSLQKVLEEFMSKNPEVNAQDIPQILKASVV